MRALAPKQRNEGFFLRRVACARLHRVDVRTKNVVCREVERFSRRRLVETPRGMKGGELPDSTTLIRQRLFVGVGEVSEEL